MNSTHTAGSPAGSDVGFGPAVDPPSDAPIDSHGDPAGDTAGAVGDTAGAGALGRLRDEILLATLPNIVFDGWSRQAMREGARMSGHDEEALSQAFPGGVPDLVEHFSHWADREMLKALETRDVAALPVRDRITLAVRLRFELLEPYRDAVSRLVAWLALPQNSAMGVRLLYRTVDTMWYAAGDASTDYNHYTKRALLAAVQTSTTFYWLDDQSEEAVETWAFLDRRISDVLRFGRAVRVPTSLGQLVGALPSPFRLARQLRQRTRDV